MYTSKVLSLNSAQLKSLLFLTIIEIFGLVVHLHHIVNLPYYKNKNWLQFLFIVKAAVLKQ